MFNSADNVNVLKTQNLQSMLGDLDQNGKIDPGNATPETAVFVGNYLLWSAGPDENFGPTTAYTAANPPSSRSPCDDVANFERGQY